MLNMNISVNVTFDTLFDTHCCRPSSSLYSTLTKGMSEQERCQIKVRFYVLDKEESLLKRIVIEEMVRIGESARLQAWAQEKQLITTVEKGDKVFAFTSSNVSEKMKGKDFSIDGKEVVVEILTARDYDDIVKISAFVIALLESNNASKTEKKSASERIIRRMPTPQERAMDNFEMYDLFRKLINHSEKVKDRLLAKWRESNLEQRSLNEEAHKRKQMKKKDIEHRLLEKDILTREINASEAERRRTFVELFVKN